MFKVIAFRVLLLKVSDVLLNKGVCWERRLSSAMVQMCRGDRSRAPGGNKFPRWDVYSGGNNRKVKGCGSDFWSL